MGSLKDQGPGSVFRSAGMFWTMSIKIFSNVIVGYIFCVTTVRACIMFAL